MDFLLHWPLHTPKIHENSIWRWRIWGNDYFIWLESIFGNISSILNSDSNRLGWTGMVWISLCWKYLKCTIFSIQLDYYDLQCMPPVLYIMGRNTMCALSVIPNVFSFGFLEYSVAHNIHHKQSSDTCGPHVVALLTWTSTSEWQKARLVIKNGHQREMCHIENGLLIDIILGSTDYIIGKTYVITQDKENLHFGHL